MGLALGMARFDYFLAVCIVILMIGNCAGPRLAVGPQPEGQVTAEANALLGRDMDVRLKQAERLYIQAGAGIVYDSVPANEWAETMNKGRAIFRAVALAEAGLPSRDPCAEAQAEDKS